MNIRWYHVIALLIVVKALTGGYGYLRKEEATDSRPPETAALKEPGKPHQDFIVGTWEMYAVSDSTTGPKKSFMIEKSDSSLSMTFCADGTWQLPISESESGGGTWEKFANGYLCQEEEEDFIVFREGEHLYTVSSIEGIGNVWMWYRRTTPRQSSEMTPQGDD